MPQNIKEHIYFVSGMYCASCEILIEKKLLEFDGIKSVDVSLGKGRVLIEYEGERPSVKKLNETFKKENYVFSENKAEPNPAKKKDLFLIFSSALLLIFAFIGLNKLGLAGIINVGETSSLPMFFVLGLIAGISSCAALVGGLVLSMSKQWLEIYSDKESIIQKLQPHFMFNVGRLVSYAVLGFALGFIGSRLQISLKFTSVLVIAVSVMMIFLALQMWGVKALRKFQFSLPKSITRYAADESNFKGRYMPFLMGAFTFFLPCGFTITAQGLALISGSPIQGALIMFLFALGTLPTLLMIGFSSIQFSQSANFSDKFLKIAGVLVLFFALFNINSQLNILGLSSFSDLGIKNNQIASEEGLAPLVNNKQIIKMSASASGYRPNYFKVRAGIPVRWEITDTGTSGCTNAVISNSLFSGVINLTPNQVAVKEFTPQKAGKYKFSCWMGMISGVIEVVDGKPSAKSTVAGIQEAKAAEITPSGAKGCGCGGGSSCGLK